MEYEYQDIDPIEEAKKRAAEAASNTIDPSIYLLDYSKPIPKPKAVITDPTNPHRIIVSEQNIFAIIGREKSFKSFCASLLVIDYFKQHPDEKCLLIDTEQADWNVSNVAKRVCDGLGWDYAEAYNSGRLRIANLRKYTKKERLAAVEILINAYHPYLVIVDGIRDLVESVNEDVECSNVLDKFMKWSEEYNCAIGTILHTNKDGETAKGHLGAELLAKAEIVLLCNVKNEGRGTEVKCFASRNERIESFEIEIDDHYVPHRVSKDKDDEEEIQFSNEKETRAYKALKHQSGRLKAEWIADIRNSILCAKATAEKYFSDFFELGILVQDGKDSEFYSHYLTKYDAPKKAEADTQIRLPEAEATGWCDTNSMGDDNGDMPF